jgi:hypothetical protein
MAPNFVINKLGYYFMLTNEVAKMLDVTKLQDCQVFDNMQSFYEAVHARHPDISDINELQGSYIELWYDDEMDMIVADHIHIDNTFFVIETFAQDLSEFGE